ncbi:MAG: SUMF1/EgtB/PvdO family nonheme iron enzyme [Halioglobus sp.]|nr:SUMF1/EgtB/PvdO family nonheme iron enzyme [Halioglobus sp.]
MVIALALVLALTVWLVVRFAAPPATTHLRADAASAPPSGSLLRDTLADGSPGPELVVIPAGRFVMGADGPHAQAQERPVREVVLQRPLAVARTETTVAQFARFVQGAGYLVQRGCWYHTNDGKWLEIDSATWLASRFAQGDDHPVTCVNHRDASVYAAWLSQQTGHHYRLPSEAEFEYFNRAGVTENLPARQREAAAICRVANSADASSGLHYAVDCDDGYHHTSPVANYDANAFGLFDTSGNLWEFTLDCWNPNYEPRWRTLFQPPPVDGSAWMRGDCGRHVLRGGSYLSAAENLRLSRRKAGGAMRRVSSSGFRVVREF